MQKRVMRPNNNNKIMKQGIEVLNLSRRSKSEGNSGKQQIDKVILDEILSVSE